MTPVSLSLLLCSFSQVATEPPLEEPSCPELLGEPELREERRQEREALLKFVQVNEGQVVVAHSGHFQSPTELHLAGLELVAVEPSEPSAVVQLDAEVAGVDCPSGEYRLEVDDALGPGGQVLAIFSDTVLLLFDQELHYLSLSELPMRWSLVWVSPWPINPYRHGLTAPRAVPQPPRPGRR